MDNQTLKSQFFRSISVHLRELHVLAPFSGAYPFTLDVCFQIFRSISVQPCMELSAHIFVSGAYPFILSLVSVSFVLVNLYETAQSWQEQQRI